LETGARLQKRPSSETPVFGNAFFRDQKMKGRVHKKVKSSSDSAQTEAWFPVSMEPGVISKICGFAWHKPSRSFFRESDPLVNKLGVGWYMGVRKPALMLMMATCTELYHALEPYRLQCIARYTRNLQDLNIVAGITLGYTLWVSAYINATINEEIEDNDLDEPHALRPPTLQQYLKMRNAVVDKEAGESQLCKKKALPMPNLRVIRDPEALTALHTTAKAYSARETPGQACIDRLTAEFDKMSRARETSAVSDSRLLRLKVLKESDFRMDKLMKEEDTLKRKHEELISRRAKMQCIRNAVKEPE